MARTTGCFLIGATGLGVTVRGEALLGSVSDDPYDVRTFLRAVAPPGKLAHVGTELFSTTEHTLSERGYFARPGETTRGINAAGLAFTCAMVIEDPSAPRTLTARPYADVTDEMMRTCRTVGEAISQFEAAGATAPAYSVLLADAEGGLAHLEVGSFGTSVVDRCARQQGGAVFAVNCYLSPALVDYNDPPSRIENTKNNNLARREQGTRFVAAERGRIDVTAVARLLSDHANRQRDPLDNPILPAWGYSICNHGTRGRDDYPHEDLPWGTVSAEILEPSAGTFWYAYGWPCGERPEHGDQLFQERSWGQFVPFALPGEPLTQAITPLTTVAGEITADGSDWRLHTTARPAHP